MKFIKTLLLGLIIGLALGLWFGVNIGKGKPIHSNPFAEESIQDKFKRKVGEGVEKAGESIEKLGEDLSGKMKK